MAEISKELPSNAEVGASKSTVQHSTGNGHRRALGPEIDEAARALRHTKEELHDNFVAPYIDRAAGQLEQLSGFLRTSNVHDVVTRMERFARREPLLFLGGAFGIGLICARFLKSSARFGEPAAPKEPIAESAAPGSVEGGPHESIP